MSNYQAVFDAVRSSISNTNIGQAVENAIGRPDLAFPFQQAAQEIAAENTRPCVVFRPKVFLDGEEWCALYGENIQDGVSAFGSSPREAVWNFDKEWNKKLEQNKSQKKPETPPTPEA